MDAPSSAAAAPSEILDLAAVPRPMQQRVHIVVQVDWFQIADHMASSMTGVFAMGFRCLTITFLFHSSV